MHDAAFEAAGIDAHYELLELEPDAVEAAVTAARGPGWLGLQVTAPYKRMVAGLCDRVEPDAATIGAVNSVVRSGTGELVGFNTDAPGFRAGVELAMERPADHPFVQVAAALSDASVDGACRLLLRMPDGWQPLVPWIEQLMEESLGKGGKGVVVFDDQFLNPGAPGYRSSGTLHVRVVADLPQAEEEHSFNLSQPYLARKEPLDRLAAVATSFLGWQLSMALYGYLQRITFAGQPAVENYKARARVLRAQDDPLQVTKNWAATSSDTEPTSGMSYILLAPQGVEIQGPPASIFARTLLRTFTASTRDLSPGYLDLTINGERPSSVGSALNAHLHIIGNELLGIPVKLRRAPAAYHSTEQSEMDGPPLLVSLRVLARDHEETILGSYTDTFLCAQAVSTWQAMIEQGRTCFLLIMDGSIDDAVEPFHRFFSEVTAHLGGQ